MEHSRNNRRTFLGGIIASIGAALSATTAFALPPGTQGLLGAATRLLRRFGVGVTARVDPELERDVLTFTIDPKEGTQYDQRVNMPRALDTCWLTSSFGDLVQFTLFDPSTGEPSMMQESQGGRTTLEIFDRGATFRLMIAGGPTYELHDGVLVML